MSIWLTSMKFVLSRANLVVASGISSVPGFSRGNSAPARIRAKARPNSSIGVILRADEFMGIPEIATRRSQVLYVACDNIDGEFLPTMTQPESLLFARSFGGLPPPPEIKMRPSIWRS